MPLASVAKQCGAAGRGARATEEEEQEEVFHVDTKLPLTVAPRMEAMSRPANASSN
jgi:hypothetical protein